MRNIRTIVSLDGVPTKVYLNKVSKERRFKVNVDGNISEYGLSDETNELVYLDGPELNEFLVEYVINLISQYFPRCRAIHKLGTDDYADYDDY